MPFDFTPAVFAAKERSVTTIPIDLVLRDGRLDLLESVQRKAYFDIRFAGDRLVVTAGKFIGLIPLNERVYLRVEPKMPVRNLLRVISTIGGRLLEVDAISRQYAANPEQHPDILASVGRLFVSSLQRLQVQGLRKTYSNSLETGSGPKGQIQFDLSIQGPWSRGRFHSATYAFHELSADVPENQVLRQTLLRLLQHHVVTKSLDVLIRGLCDLDDWMDRAGVSVKREAIESNHQREGDPTYRAALELSEIILSDQGIDLENEGSSARLPSFLVDLEDLFEKYVRAVTERRLRGVRVLDGNKAGAKPLFDDRPAPLANPDVAIHGIDRCRLIVEVKYKASESREDVNQVLAYALTYAVRQVVIVVPCETGQASGMTSVGRVGTVELLRYRFDLTGDLEAAEVGYARNLQTLLPGSEAV